MYFLLATPICFVGMMISEAIDNGGSGAGFLIGCIVGCLMTHCSLIKK